MARYSIFCCLIGLLAVSSTAGCRNYQHAKVLSQNDKDMVGSHTAGAETWKPLIDESVCRLMAKAAGTVHQASHTTMGAEGTIARTVCFVGVENRSSEEIGDFKEQIYEHIDSQISQDPQFHMISRRYVEAAMSECRCRPDTLVLPAKQRELQIALERADQPFDYLLFASITSGTTSKNGDYQRDYLLTLELLNIHTGESQKDSAMLRKGYHKGIFAKLKR